MVTNKKILIVEDDKDILELVKLYLGKEGFRTATASTGTDALKQVNEAGGTTVSERQAVGDMGFTAYCRDSEGNLVGLWETAPSG